LWREKVLWVLGAQFTLQEKFLLGECFSGKILGAYNKEISGKSQNLKPIQLAPCANFANSA
jgi:hypothetical protein